jgi:hypothetical protein
MSFGTHFITKLKDYIFSDKIAVLDLSGNVLGD